MVSIYPPMQKIPDTVSCLVKCKVDLFTVSNSGVQHPQNSAPVLLMCSWHETQTQELVLVHLKSVQCLLRQCPKDLKE